MPGYYGVFPKIEPVVEFGERTVPVPTVASNGLPALSMGWGSPAMNAAIAEREKRDETLKSIYGEDFNKQQADGYTPFTRDINTSLQGYADAVNTEVPNTGGGLLGSILTTAIGTLTGNPFIGAFLGSTFGNQGGGVLGSLTGAASGILAGMNSSGYTGGGGFSNPSALGLSGSNLSLPGLVNAPQATGITGYGASGLGLTGANLGLGFASGAFPALPVAGYGASAVGGNPASLYNPASLGGTPAASSTPSLSDAARLLSLAGTPTDTSTGGGGLLGGGGMTGGTTGRYEALVPQMEISARNYRDHFRPNRFMGVT